MAVEPSYMSGHIAPPSGKTTYKVNPPAIPAYRIQRGLAATNRSGGLRNPLAAYSTKKFYNAAGGATPNFGYGIKGRNVGGFLANPQRETTRAAQDTKDSFMARNRLIGPGGTNRKLDAMGVESQGGTVPKSTKEMQLDSILSGFGYSGNRTPSTACESRSLARDKSPRFGLGKRIAQDMLMQHYDQMPMQSSQLQPTAAADIKFKRRRGDTAAYLPRAKGRFQRMS